MKKYFYFFNFTIQNVLVGGSCYSTGIYQTDKKIIDEKEFSKFFNWVKSVTPCDFSYKNKDITVNALTFLHEVEE